MLRKLCYSVKKDPTKAETQKILTGYKENTFSAPCSNYIFLTYHFLSHQLVYLKLPFVLQCETSILLTWVHDYTWVHWIYLFNVSHPKRHILENLQQFSPFYLKHPSVHEWMKAQDVQAHSFHIKVFCWNCSTCSQPSKKKKVLRTPLCGRAL